MLPTGDVGIAEVIGTSVKDVETLDLNVDLGKVKTVTKPVSKRRLMLSFVVEFQMGMVEGRINTFAHCWLQVRVRPGTKRMSAREADSNDVTGFDDNTMATIVDRAVLVHRRNNKEITPATVANKVARLAGTEACHVVAVVDAEDPLVVTSVVISAGEEVADLRVVLVARTAK